MRLASVLALLAASLLGPMPVTFAQPAASFSCDDYGGYDLQDCLSGELTKADKALNAAYRKALASIGNDPDTPDDEKLAWKDNLKNAQRAWIVFRDANCKFELIGAEWHNGSGTTAAQLQCELGMTQQRTEELLSRLPDAN